MPSRRFRCSHDGVPLRRGAVDPGSIKHAPEPERLVLVLVVRHRAAPELPCGSESCEVLVCVPRIKQTVHDPAPPRSCTRDESTSGVTPRAVRCSRGVPARLTRPPAYQRPRCIAPDGPCTPPHTHPLPTPRRASIAISQLFPRYLFFLQKKSGFFCWCPYYLFSAAVRCRARLRG